MHCNPHLSRVNWLLESISSTRISLLPEPYQYHFIIPANKTAVPNIANHIIISEHSLLVRTLSRLQCTLRCHQFPGGVLHLFTQIKHSISFVLQVEPHSHSALPVWELQEAKTRAGCWKQKPSGSFTSLPWLTHSPYNQLPTSNTPPEHWWSTDTVVNILETVC